MRPPLEYGDNFPVPTGSWDPAVPWRFPYHQIRLRKPPLLVQIIPWIMLGIGMILGFGILWVGSHLVGPLHALDQEASDPAVLEKGNPVLPLNFSTPSPQGTSESPLKVRPIRQRSRLA